MGLETPTYIDTLNSGNPASGDSPREGDDHIRNLKAAIKATFPNIAGAVTPTHTELNFVDGVTSAIQTQLNARAALAVENAWTAQQIPMNGNLSGASSTVDWDADTQGQIVKLTLSQSVTLNAPTNILEHCVYSLRVTQGASPYTITWAGAYKFPGGIDPVVSTGSGAIDIYTFIGGAGNAMYCVGQAKGLA